MSIDTSKNFHLEFLRRYFSLPDPERKEPYVAAGIRGAKSFSEGFPDEALVDRLFTKDVDAARFALVRAYLAFDANVGWLCSSTKKPVIGQSLCEKLFGKALKQGFCQDFDLLENLYNRFRGTNRQAGHFGYHTNFAGVPFVIDLDFKEGDKDAAQTFFAFLEEHGVDPRSIPCVMTPGGGLHLYFQHYDGEHKSPSNFAPELWGRGVDIRGCGSLVLGAGSFDRVDGKFKQYVVLNNCPPPPLPRCVAEVIEKHNEKQKTPPPCDGDIQYDFDSGSELDYACRLVVATREGSRNKVLNNNSFAIGKLIGAGKVDETEARRKFMEAAKRCGLKESDAFATISGAIKKGKESPVPYAPFGRPEEAVEAPAKPTVRKIPAREKTEDEMVEMTEEQFLAEKEMAQFVYSPGFLTRFAERNGRIDKKRVYEIAKKIFPPKIFEYVCNLHDLFKIDLTALVQAMATAPCQTLKGARQIDMGGKNNTMHAGLFVMVMGAPACGKTLLSRQLYRVIDERQAEEFEQYIAAWEQYVKEKSEWEKQKKKEGPRPLEPILRSYYIQDGTIEAVMKRAQSNREGIFWGIDEGAGQATLGSSRYNQAGEASALSYLIRGYDGGSILKELKKDRGEVNAEFVKNFRLAITFNIQDKKVRSTFGDGLEDQGYLARWLHISLPPKPQGKKGSAITRAADECMPSFEFYDQVINAILDLQIRHGADEFMNILQFSDEAYQLHDEWCKEVTEKCNYGSLQSYIDRFCQSNVLRLSLGLHYLHLAAQCVENGEGIGEHENFHAQQIEREDMERAIAVADLFLMSLDRFLWLRKSPERPAKTMLNQEEEALAKHVLANYQYYTEPRTAREIIEMGFNTRKTPTELSLWLKSCGFPVVKKGSRAARQVARYDLNGLKPWAGAIDLARLAFTSEDNTVLLATTIFTIWKAIESSDEFEMSKTEFSKYMKQDDESDKLIKLMLADRRFMVNESKESLFFHPKTINIVKQILTDEGLLYNDKLIAA